MGNGDKSYLHMVVRTTPYGTMLCLTNIGEPAIYADSAAAEIFRSNQDTQFPGNKFGVISFVVL